MRLVSVESDTIRPPQTEAMRSSLLTTRSRFSHQVNQQVEHLRLDVYCDFGAPKFAPFNIDFVVTKTENHSRVKAVLDRPEESMRPLKYISRVSEE